MFSAKMPKTLGKLQDMRLLTWVVLAIGVAARLRHLLGMRPLWLDEAHLAPNVLDRSFDQILHLPMTNDQIAPIGFVLTSKLFVNLLHPFELGLRLAPCLASIASLFVVLHLCRLLKMRDVTTLMTVALLALLPTQVYYAAEFKQYAIELLATAAMAVLAIHYVREQKAKWFILLWIGGLLTTLFSIAAPFTLAATGGYVLYEFWRKKNYQFCALLVGMGLTWGVVYLDSLYFNGTLSSQTMSSMKTSFWSQAMRPDGAIAMLQWLTGVLPTTIEAMGVSPIGAGFLTIPFIAGIYHYYSRKNYALLFLLIAPLALALLGAMTRNYPFTGRLLLFAAPGILIMLAEGISALHDALPRTVLARSWLVFMFVVLLMPDFGKTLVKVAHKQPFNEESLPTMMAYIAENIQPGQSLYIHAFSRPVFNVYKAREKLDTYTTYYGHDARGTFNDSFDYDNRGNYANFLYDIERLQDKGKVWMLFSSRTNDEGKSDIRTALHFADLTGHLVTFKEIGGSAAYLYDFSRHENLQLTSRPVPPYHSIHKSYD